MEAFTSHVLQKHHCLIANCSYLISMLRYLMSYLQEVQGQRTGRFHRPQKPTTESGKKNSQPTPTSCQMCTSTHLLLASSASQLCTAHRSPYVRPHFIVMAFMHMAVHSMLPHVQPDTWPWSPSPSLPLPFRSSITAAGLLLGLLVGCHLWR